MAAKKNSVLRFIRSNKVEKSSYWLRKHVTEQQFFSLSFQFVKKASEKLSKMTDAFFGRLVPSEDLLLKTPNLAISLKRSQLMMQNDSVWEMGQVNSSSQAALEI